MNTFPVHPPYAIQLEPVEGCPLACSFCALQAIRANGASWATGAHGAHSGPYRFMEGNTVRRVMQECSRLGWDTLRVEFAMHGEPTMHPQLAQFVALARSALPRAYLQVTTNGAGLVADTSSRIDALFAAGLNTLVLDNYLHADFVPRILAAWANGPQAVPLYHYPAEHQGNPHRKHAGKLISVVQDISQNTHGTHTLTNQGGNSGKHEQLQQRCAKPFRELSVRWDGNVALCCDDWPGHYKVGSVHAMPLDALWLHPRFEAARRRLVLGERTFGPCIGCNVRTPRPGLLPDPQGQARMEPPTNESDLHIADALRGAQYTPRVIRD